MVEMVTTVEWLSNYDIGFPTSMKSQRSASHSSSGNGGQLGRSNKFRSERESNGSSP